VSIRTKPAKPAKEIKKIELNEQFLKAFDLMENSFKNVFITGRAGTGKSTLLDYFRTNTAKKVVVLAPTGVAAINVKGQTVHSFFRFKPDVTLNSVKKIFDEDDDDKNIYAKLDAIIIDEISMVRADLLDCIDKFLRLNGKDGAKPFGGAQMIFIGDLYQLSPVVTRDEKEIFKENYKSQYFFDAKVFERGADTLFGDDFKMEFIELEKIYRQNDKQFIDMLNSIRNKTVSEEELETLNARFIPDFEHKFDDYYIYLTTTNKLAAERNEERLEKLKGEPYRYYGQLKGNFENKYLSTAIELNIKIGSQVMLLNNDPAGRWVNGSIGKIVDVYQDEDEDDIIDVELSNGRLVDVTPYTWEIYSYKFDASLKGLVSEAVGSFTQYPLKLAWAVTIHKSQGKTFDKVIIDIGNGTFAHGQLYVALSRCTTLDGIVLKKKIQKKHIFMDWKVIDFLTKYQYGLSERDFPLEEKIKMINEAIAGKYPLEIVYLKSRDEKSSRKILPSYIGEMEYSGKGFLGLRAYCFNRNDERTFRVDRILELQKSSVEIKTSKN
jgi:ATP-dependent exoDNAse (exonuclease V) alpha subunit